MLLATFKNIALADTISLNSLNTTVEFDYAYFDRKSEFESRQHTASTSLLIEGNIDLTNNTFIEFKPLLRADNHNFVENQFQYKEDKEKRPSITFNELYFIHYGEQFEFSIGKQIFSWGLGDLINTNDDLNPVDILDSIDSEKLGQSSISGRYLGDRFNLHGAVVFQPAPARLPQQDSRWFISLSPLQEAMTPKYGFAPEVSFADASSVDAPNIGLQLTSSSWFTGWDTEFTYYSGHDPVGVYLLDLEPTRLKLTRHYPKFHEYGAGFSTEIDEFEIHGTISYHDTERDEMDDDFFVGMIGGRRTFYDIPFLTNVEELTVGIEYIKENILHKKTENSRFISSGFGRMLTDTVLTRLNFKFSEDSSLEFINIYNRSDNDNYIGVELSHKWADNLKSNLRFDFLSGGTNTLFGSWKDNDRILLKTSYNF